MQDPVVVDGVMRPDLDHRWVTRETIAQYLGVAGNTVHTWRLQGQFPDHSMRWFGNRVRYRPDLIAQALS